MLSRPKRPLSPRQIEYALHDVHYLQDIAEILTRRIAEMGRSEWLAGEMENWQQTVEDFEQGERWMRTAEPITSTGPTSGQCRACVGLRSA